MPAPSHSPLSISAADWLMLIALSLLWGGSFYFAKVAVLEIPPLTLALGRVAIAAAALAVVIRAFAGPLLASKASKSKPNIRIEFWASKSRRIGT